MLQRHIYYSIYASIELLAYFEKQIISEFGLSMKGDFNEICNQQTIPKRIQQQLYGK